jgi:hypothetical protein
VTDRQEPRPSEGETPVDEQSETVGDPHRDDAPPRRDARAPLTWALLIGLLLLLGIALVVLAVSVLV